jgi:hypothetical protein
MYPKSMDMIEFNDDFYQVEAGLVSDSNNKVHVAFPLQKHLF